MKKLKGKLNMELVDELKKLAVLGIIALCVVVFIFMVIHEYDSKDSTEHKHSAGVGVKVINAARINPSTDMVQITPVPDINPYTGKPEVDYSSRGEALFVPENMGAVHSFMSWCSITDPTTKQFQLREEAEAYDEYDFGRINDRYVVAVKPYYGKIGDYIDVIQEDDTVIHCIIGDYKGDENQAMGDIAKYCHHDMSIVEFIVNGYSAWYTEGTRRVCDFHPEFNRNIKTIYNVGNYWNE